MRNCKSTEIASVLVASVALAAIFFSSHEFAPRVDRKLHAAIGRALAKEALSLLGPGGKITVITRDTKAFPQPAIDVLLESFKRELRRADATLGATQLIQVDPLRPVAVPSGDFFELIRRSPAEHVIVSLLGPPLLTEEQRIRLGRVKPKIVAFCSGSVVENIALRQLFDAGLLHAAIVNRPSSATATGNQQKVADTFDQLYLAVRAANLSTLPAPSDSAL
jgi:hypothetical protein